MVGQGTKVQHFKGGDWIHGNYHYELHYSVIKE